VKRAPEDLKDVQLKSAVDVLHRKIDDINPVAINARNKPDGDQCSKSRTTDSCKFCDHRDFILGRQFCILQLYNMDAWSGLIPCNQQEEKAYRLSCVVGTEFGCGKTGPAIWDGWGFARARF